MSDYERIRFRLQTPDVSVYDYVCRYPRTTPSETRTASHRQLCLPREGVCVVECGGREYFLDPNQAFLFDRGDEYRIRHLACDCTDCGTGILVREPLLLQAAEAVEIADPRVAFGVFREKSLPVTPGINLLHFQLLGQCGDGELDPLAGEELAVLLVEAVLGRWVESGVASAVPNEADLRISRAVKLVLAESFTENPGLASIAEAVGCTVSRLCHAFRRVTGSTVHSYLVALRMKEAVRRIAQGEDDLSGLAADLGFSSHSHFTSVFHRELGRTPSEYRCNVTKH